MKLKRELLKIFKYYTLSRGVPSESLRPKVNVIIKEPAATGFYEGHILVSGGTALHCEVLDRTHNERWLQRSAPVDSWKPGKEARPGSPKEGRLP